MEIRKFRCIVCGKEFEKKVYGKGREYKFCGYSCYWKYKKGKKPKHLPGFQKGNKVNLGRKRPDLTLRNMRSNPMKTIEAQEKSSESHKIHGKWIGRSKALRYRKQICEVCGEKEKLHVHHINKDRTDNHLENLLVVCVKCHMKIHKKLNEIENGKCTEFCKKQI